MFTRKTLLALSISCLFSTANAVDPEQYNYDTSITSKELGVDVNKLLECGSDYGSTECRDSTNVTQSGYQKNTVVNNAQTTAKKTEQEKQIANTDAESLNKLGINGMDDVTDENHYNKSRDIGEQKNTVNELMDEWSNTDVSDLTSTYRTGSLPSNEGYDFKYKCMAYSDAQLDEMSDSTDLKQKSLANQCLSVRTVANTNDKALANRLSKNDELRKDTPKRAVSNNSTNTAVTNVNALSGSATTANNMSYACDFSPTTKVTKNSTCNVKGVGRHQVCTQALTIECGQGVTGTRELPECISGMDHGTVKLRGDAAPSFRATDNSISLYESWDDGSSSSQRNWYIDFMVKNPDKVSINLASVHYDNAMIITVNGFEVLNKSTNSNANYAPNLSLQPFIRMGLNTVTVKFANWHGPASAAVNITIDPSSYTGCMCKESWKTTCTMSNVEL